MDGLPRGPPAVGAVAGGGGPSRPTAVASGPLPPPLLASQGLPRRRVRHGLAGSKERPGGPRAPPGLGPAPRPRAGRTCVDELHVALQVAVDHEHLVAAGVRAGPLPHLLVMLLHVLLRGRGLSARPGLRPPEAPPRPAPPAAPLTFMPSAPRYTAVQPWWGHL